MGFLKDLSLGVNLLGRDISASDALKKLGKNVGLTESKFEKWGKTVNKTFDAVALAAGAAAVKLGVDSVKAASDLGETVSKTNVIFGKSAKELQKWAEQNANNMGQTQQQALDAASTFAVFGKAAGLQGPQLNKFSQKLVTLSSDLASFYNTDPTDAIESIGAALRGESEPIRKYGVMLDDATLKAAALKMGLYDGKGALDIQSKSLAAYQVILNQTKDAQGDFARTSDGLANSSRILEAQIHDAQLEIGTALLPVVQEVVQYMKSKEGKQAIKDFAGALADAIKTAADNLPKVWEFLKKVGKTASGLGLNFDKLLDPRMLAAAAAFRLTPGGIQYKAIAAIAAYAAADYGQYANDKTTQTKRNEMPGWAKGMDLSGAKGKAQIEASQKNLQNLITGKGGATTKGYMDWSQYIPTPKMAKGGIVRQPTMALIGEAGPEAVVPLNKGMGGMVVNVHVAGSVIRERDLAVSVRDNIAQMMRRRGLDPAVLGV